MSPVFFLIKLCDNLQTLFCYKHLFKHHFRTEEEEAANFLMLPAVLAPLLIVCYPVISIAVLVLYVDIYLGHELNILF